MMPLNPGPGGVECSVGEATSSVSEAQASGLGIDDLLGGLVGALLVFFFTVGYTEIRDRRQRARESAGYARVLGVELETNEQVVEQVEAEFNARRGMFVGGLANAQYDPPKIEAWLETRMKLAPLITTEEFQVINDYYRQLQVLLDLKERRKVARAGMRLEMFVRDLRAGANKTQGIVSGYANSPRRWWEFWR